MQSKSLLTSIAVLTVVLAGCNATNNSSAEARTAAQDFYVDWSNNSSVTPVSARYDTNAHITTRFRNRLSALMNDNDRVSSVVCGNGIPTSFDVSSDVRMTGDDTATVTVTQHFATGDVPVQVNLVRNGSANSNAWFIDEVNCPNDDSNDDSNDDGSDDDSDDDDSDDNSSSSSISSSLSSSASTTSSSSSSSSSHSSLSSSSSSEREKAGKGQFCGGIAGIQCANGLTCEYEGSYPDAGGTCI